MPSNALRDYTRKLDSIEQTRKRMDSLSIKKKVSRSDMMSAYESLFLRAIVGFESFCEQLFFDIVDHRVFYKRREVSTALRRIPSKKQNQVMRRIVFQDDAYLEWIPWDKTRNRADKYLKEGRPFSLLDSNDIGTLTKMVAVRNAIAHASEHAQARFKRTVLSQVNLVPADRNAAGLLRSVFSSNPPLNYFQFYSNSLRNMAARVYGAPVR